jgi:leucyl/phenylalanyl-tRNA---protein transferase
VAIGGLFAGESMFHRERDASKVALVALVDLLGADGDDRRLLDVQWATEHLASMGAIEIPRTAYLALLDRALQAPPAPGWSADYDDAEAVAPPSTTSKARATRPDA